MSHHCDYCGAVAGYGHELGHRSDCPSLQADALILRGHAWRAKELSIGMAYDAFRMALGGEPTSFTRQEVILWLQKILEQEGSGLSSPEPRSGDTSIIKDPPHG